MKKKLLAILMTVCMTVVFMPSFTWATGDDTEQETGAAQTEESVDSESDADTNAGQETTDDESEAESANLKVAENEPETKRVCPGRFEVIASGDTTGVEYSSLDVAGKNVTEGGTIKLLEDCTAEPWATAAQQQVFYQNEIQVGTSGVSNFTLDLNGCIMNFQHAGDSVYPYISLQSGTMTIENGYILSSTTREFQGGVFYKAKTGTEIIFRNGDTGEYGYYGGTFDLTDGHGTYDIQSGFFFLGYNNTSTPDTETIMGFVNDNSALNVRNPLASGLDYSAVGSSTILTQQYYMNYISENAKNPVEILNASGNRTSTYFALDVALKCVESGQTIRLINKDTTLLQTFNVNSTNVPNVTAVTIDMNGFDLISNNLSSMIEIDTDYSLNLKDGRSSIGDDKSIVSLEHEGLKTACSVIRVNGCFSASKIQFDCRNCTFSKTKDAKVITNEGETSIDNCKIYCTNSNVTTIGVDNSKTDLEINDLAVVGDAGCGSIYGVKQTASNCTLDNIDITVSGEALSEIYGIYTEASNIQINDAAIDVSNASEAEDICCIAGEFTVLGGHYYSGSSAPFYDGETKAKGGYYSCTYTTFPDENLYDSTYKCVSCTEEYGDKQYISRVVADNVARAYSNDTEIGDGYPTLQEAIDAIEDGNYTSGKVKLIKGITETNQLRSNSGEAQFGEAADASSRKTIYFDLNGYSINVSMSSKYPIFIEKSKVILMNSQSTVSEIINTSGDAIHIGDKDSATNSILVINDTNHKIHIAAKGAHASEQDDAIQLGWGWDDSSGTHVEYKGKVQILGGCYEGCIRMPEYTRGNSKYDIKGGYFTDTGIKYESETSTTVGKNAYVNSAYVGIENPDSEVKTSESVTYPVKVVPRVYVYAVSTICLDKVQVYYYVTGLSADDVTSEKYKIQFTAEDETKTVVINSSSSTAGTLDDKTLYKIAVPQKFAAKNIVDEIETKVFDENEALYDHYKYSVSGYCYGIKNTTGDDAPSTQLKNLCMALLNYGAASQNYFSYSTENLANKDLTGDEQSIKMPSSYEEINAVAKEDIVKKTDKTTAQAIGQSLVLNDETSIKIYLSLSTDNSYKAYYSKGSSISSSTTPLTLETVGTEESDIHYNGDLTEATHYVVIPEIKSTYIEDPYTVCIENTADSEDKLLVTYSASTWAKNVWANSSTDNTIALCKSIVAFGTTSVEYTNSKNGQQSGE